MCRRAWLRGESASTKYKVLSANRLPALQIPVHLGWVQPLTARMVRRGKSAPPWNGARSRAPPGPRPLAFLPAHLLLLLPHDALRAAQPHQLGAALHTFLHIPYGQGDQNRSVSNASMTVPKMTVPARQGTRWHESSEEASMTASFVQSNDCCQLGPATPTHPSLPQSQHTSLPCLLSRLAGASRPTS